MIVVAIIAACMAAVIVILNLLPVWSPVDFSGAVTDLMNGAGSGVFDGLAWMNYYVPVGEMLVLLIIQIGLWGGIRLVQFGVWLLQLFHIAGGGD